MSTASAGGDPVRELLAESDGLRVQLVSVGRGQSVRWHSHTNVTDTILAVAGIVLVETDSPQAHHRLEPGDRVTIPVGTSHRVLGEGGAPCRFVNIHAGGTYDFRPQP